MYQLTRRLTAPMTAALNPVAQGATAPRTRLRRLLATSAFALLSLATYQPSAQAQTLTEGEVCYAIADNNPPGVGSGGGRNNPDTLSRIDNFAAGQASAIGTVVREDGSPISDIEALTSRPDFGELIAANGNEIGKIDPDTGVFTSLGLIEGFRDFDAIVIDRNSANQTRLIGVSKARGTGGPDDQIVQINITLDENGQATRLDAASLQRGATVSFDGFPGRVDGIDGIAISPSGIVYGVANGGPRTPQRFVSIDLASGALQDLGPFTLSDGTLIEDVEDLSFDLTNGLLFATSGSNFSPLTGEAFLFNDPQGGNLGPAISNFNLEAATGAIDYEASACIRSDEEPQFDALLLVKRITAITRNGEEIRYDDQFVDQEGDRSDNRMRRFTEQNFPLGLVSAPRPLSAGDQVEYTVYVYNPTNEVFRNIVLCDPLQLPNVLQRNSIEFAPPNNNLTLNFDSANGFARRPLAAADPACSQALDGEEQFLGPAGPNGPGGGVVSNEFNLRPGQVSATRFVVEVGQLQNGQAPTNGDG